MIAPIKKKSALAHAFWVNFSLLLALLLPQQAFCHTWPAALEKFKIEELSLYSIYIGKYGRSVDFLAKDGFLYTAAIGTPVSILGLSVRKIEKHRVILVETVLDRDGDWIENEIEWKVNQRPVELTTKKNLDR